MKVFRWSTMASALAITCTVGCGSGGCGSNGPAPLTGPDAPAQYNTLWGVEFGAGIPASELASAQANLHVGLVRIGIVEAWAKGDNWKSEDAMVDGAKAAGLRLIVITPAPKSTSEDDTAADVAFTQTVAARYANMNIIWEIMNEPDIPTANGSTPKMSPSYYASFVEQVAPLIRKADPTATIVTGGTSGLDLSWDQGISGAFSAVDGVGLHPYGVDPVSFGQAIEKVLEIDGGKPVYLTEWGLVQGTSGLEGMVTAAITAAAGRTPEFNYFTYQDGPGESNFGLVSTGGSQEPLYGTVSSLYGSASH